MKTLKIYSATLALVFALSGVALAGQTDMPPVASIPSSGAPVTTSYSDSWTELTVSLIQSLLSVF